MTYPVMLNDTCAPAGSCGRAKLDRYQVPPPLPAPCSATGADAVFAASTPVPTASLDQLVHFKVTPADWYGSPGPSISVVFEYHRRAPEWSKIEAEAAAIARDAPMNVNVASELQSLTRKVIAESPAVPVCVVDHTSGQGAATFTCFIGAGVCKMVSTLAASTWCKSAILLYFGLYTMVSDARFAEFAYLGNAIPVINVERTSVYQIEQQKSAPSRESTVCFKGGGQQCIYI